MWDLPTPACPMLELPGVAPFDLVEQEAEEEVGVREVVVDGLART